MNRRLLNLRAALKKIGLDCLILFSAHNISYLTHFSSRDSYLILGPNKVIYLTDARYTQEAKRYLKGYAIQEINGSVFDLIATFCTASSYKKVGFEEKQLSVFDYRKLKDAFRGAADLIPVPPLIEEARKIKERTEIDKIRQAVSIAESALVLIKGYITAGVRELEIDAELERFIRYAGASGTAFDTIVASGKNSSFPHHRTCRRMIKDNEPVLIDIGADYEGYKSDLTRVFFLGKINPEVRKIYDIVLGAQDRAIRSIKPGVFINKVDSIARHYIAQRGYGGFFSHSTGHGVGLEVHEVPRISRKEAGILKEGMVFTIEPAIYLPGRFGIRIEDMVLVTRKGCEVISGSLNK